MTKNTLRHYKNLTVPELDLIIKLARSSGRKMSNNEEISLNNYLRIRTSYTIELLTHAELQGDADEIRNSALKKLQKIDTEKFSVKVTLDVTPNDAESFVDELKFLLSMYAIPVDSYKLEILETQMVNPDSDFDFHGK